MRRTAPVGAPMGVLDPNDLYFGDNGRVHCGALACAGQSAFFSGLALDGQPVVSFTAAATVREPGVDLATFTCETCGRKKCPLCGALMEKVTDGCIAEDVMTGHGTVERRVRPGVYWSCSGCENCEEVGRA